MIRHLYLVLCTVLFLVWSFEHNAFASAKHTHYTVILIDSVHQTPIQLARVALYRLTVFTLGKVSSNNGRADITDIEEGIYTLRISAVGYRPIEQSITISSEHSIDTLWMHNLELDEITVGAAQLATIPTIDLHSGAQTLDASTYHSSPTHRIINLVQENLLGAVRAPTGEVHVKGMHGEYTYYVDGIPIPLGVFGGLNEVVDDKVVDLATLTSGTIPVDFGGQTAAIIELQNRVPSGDLHVTASTYAGSYLNRNNEMSDGQSSSHSQLNFINQNGQSLSLSDRIGNFGFFLSGTRQETDRRIDEPINSINHDHGFDYFTYAKLDYLFGDDDYATMNFSWSKTNTEIPFDPMEEGIKDDRQAAGNAYQSLSYYHTFDHTTDRTSELFVGLFSRQGNLIFTPGAIDPHTFQFVDEPDTGYILFEDRQFTTYGLRATFDKQYSHEFKCRAGIDFSTVSGIENFTASDSLQLTERTIADNYSGSNFGLFLRTTIHPVEWSTVDLGIRYDQQIAPNKALECQLQPRVKWSIEFDESSNAYFYYGKQFVTNNIEGLRLIASATDSVTTATLAERDDYFELGLIHSFDVGVRLKGDCFRRVSLPGVDDQTIGSSAVKTPVNIEKVITTGVELALSFDLPSTPLSGYINTSLIHAVGSGIISGGFLPMDNAGEGSDLDHDQRLSIATSIKYQPRDWYANITAIYGSGLTNGNEDAEFKSGLFDFNQAAHTTPSWIVNASVGYKFKLGVIEIEPSLYINNIFDHNHLLKGSFFSGAAWEEPRNIVLKVEAGI